MSLGDCFDIVMVMPLWLFLGFAAGMPGNTSISGRLITRCIHRCTRSHASCDATRSSVLEIAWKLMASRRRFFFETRAWHDWASVIAWKLRHGDNHISKQSFRSQNTVDLFMSHLETGIYDIVHTRPPSYSPCPAPQTRSKKKKKKRKKEKPYPFDICAGAKNSVYPMQSSPGKCYTRTWSN